MLVDEVELREVRLPLVTPFRTASGTMTERVVLLVRVVTADAEGWGECAALAAPTYSAEYVDGARAVLRRFLVPALRDAGHVRAEDVATVLGSVRGHPMAKSALEMAVLDAELRSAGRSLAAHLGATRSRVEVGVAVGVAESTDELLSAVARYVDAGYRRIKLKIGPGADLGPLAAVRKRFGPDLPLQVDANAAYGRSDVAHLTGLDAFDLLLIEQPFAPEDLASHVALAAAARTPVCLDESIGSAAEAAAAIDAGACSVVNVKAGRVGGYLEARRVHDACVDRGVALWCGGMLETGIGRAANLALASLPGFTLPGDISASDRYFSEDITEPFVLEDGMLAVPTGPGIGVAPVPDALEAATSSVEHVR